MEKKSIANSQKIVVKFVLTHKLHPPWTYRLNFRHGLLDHRRKHDPCAQITVITHSDLFVNKDRFMGLTN